ncbi:MAG: GNAT family N-acetyltransferase [Pseudomonadota bacterium]
MSLASIYYHTIHHINSRDYNEAQINVWASYYDQNQPHKWQSRFDRTKPFVAQIETQIVGFAEFEPTGHIDCFYVHHAYQGQKIGSALMDAIFKRAHQKNIHRIFAEVSITAQPFFALKGFKTIKKQKVTLNGITLENFVMEVLL